MSRRDEFKNVSSNPAKRFLEWKSDNQNFSYYDKEKGMNISIELPFKFLVLKEMHTVKGWHDKSQSGIYSNEVENIGQDKLTVKAFKGGTIAVGIYKDIKEVITAQGSHYSKSIYCVDEYGDIINIQLKGSSVQAWGDFTLKSRARLSDEWVIVKDAEEKQKGKVKYSVPNFFYHAPISKDDDKKADEAYNSLKDYFNGYLSGSSEIAEEEESEVLLDENGNELF